jgi:hypothetical protein
MKKSITLSCFVLILSLGLNAQTEKGHIITGLSSNFSLLTPSANGLTIGSSKFHSNHPNFVESEADKAFYIQLTPRLGYFVWDNFAAGLDLSLGYDQKKEGLSGDLYKTSTFGVGPFLRYYYPVNNFYLYGEVFARYLTRTANIDFSDNTLIENIETKGEILKYGLALGMSLPLNEQTFFDTSIGYNFSRTNPDVNGEYDDYWTAQIFSLQLGFSIFIGD